MDIGKNLSELMEQAKKMQERMQQAQQELVELNVTGESGGGMVSVQMNGRHDVLKVRIKPSLLDDDVEMLEDLVAAAVNDAVRKVEKESRAKISSLTAGLNIPNDFMKGSE